MSCDFDRDETALAAFNMTKPEEHVLAELQHVLERALAHASPDAILLLGNFSSRTLSNVRQIPQPTRFTPELLTDRLGLPGDIDLANETIDVVISANWHNETKWFRWSIQEVVRVCRPGGYCLLVIPNDGATALAIPNEREANFWKSILRRATDRSIGVTERYPNIVEIVEELGVRLVTEAVVREDPRASTVDVPLCKGIVAHTRNLGTGTVKVMLFQKIETAFCDDDRLNDPERVKAAILRDWKHEIDRLKKWQNSHRVSTCTPSVLDISAYDRPLVLSPHPDDELIGLGGTLVQLRDRGIRSTILQVTNGRSSEALHGQPEALRRSIRLEEAARVARRLGANLICWADVDDGLHPPFQHLVRRLSGVLRDVKPDAIFVPFANDPHLDHLAVNAMLAQALDTNEGASDIDIYSYDVWAFSPANRFVDVGFEKCEVLDLLAEYRTALRTVNYIRTSTWVSAWRGLQIEGHPRHVETFYQQCAQEYISDVRSVLQKTYGACC